MKTVKANFPNIKGEVEIEDSYLHQAQLKFGNDDRHDVWVAVEDNGDIYAFASEPHYDGEEWYVSVADRPLGTVVGVWFHEIGSVTDYRVSDHLAGPWKLIDLIDYGPNKDSSTQKPEFDPTMGIFN